MAAKRDMPMEASGNHPRSASFDDETREMGLPKRLILLGSAFTAVGLAVAGTAPVIGTALPDRVQAQQSVGGVVLLLGWALLAFGIHRFGRESDP
jgi:hypothetical protein